ncbi:MAG: DUF4199 domain-containing protein, partial [Flavobacteriales bacterium]
MTKKILIQGAIAGLISSVYMAILYAAGMDTFSNWMLSALLYPIIIGLVCFFTAGLKKEFQAEPFHFKQTFIVILSMMMMATLINTAWNIVLFNFIDTSLAKELSERILEQTAETMEKWGAPEAAMKETLKEMRDLPLQFKPLAQL